MNTITVHNPHNKIKRIIITSLAVLMLIGIFGITADIDRLHAETATPGDAEQDIYITDGIYADDNQNLICYVDGECADYGWHLISDPVEIIDEEEEEISGNIYYFVDKDGYVTYKVTLDTDNFPASAYIWQNSRWTLQKSKWLTVDTYTTYFNASGAPVRIYRTDKKTCYNYSNGKWVQQKNAYCKLSDGKAYYFNANGIRVTSGGWKSMGNNTLIYLGSSGYLIGKMKKSGNVWRYYIYNYSSDTWTLQKCKWVTVGNNSYYMNASGYSIRAFYGAVNKCTNYTNGKWVLFKNGYCTLQDGKAYYFNTSGIRVTSKGWKSLGGNKLIYVSSAGYMTGKMMKTGNVWRYYIYNYTTKSWVQQKSKWVTVGYNSYYMNASGYSSRAYYGSVRKCYNYRSGSWVLFRNNICSLQDGNSYYFNAYGVRVSAMGTYTTSSGVLVNTDATGKVIYNTLSVYSYNQLKYTKQPNAACAATALADVLAAYGATCTCGGTTHTVDPECVEAMFSYRTVTPTAKVTSASVSHVGMLEDEFLAQICNYYGITFKTSLGSFTASTVASWINNGGLVIVYLSSGAKYSDGSSAAATCHWLVLCSVYYENGTIKGFGTADPNGGNLYAGAASTGVYEGSSLNRYITFNTISKYLKNGYHYFFRK